MSKKLIKLTESDLHRIVKESVDNVINEAYGTPTQDSIRWNRELDAAGDSLNDDELSGYGGLQTFRNIIKYAHEIYGQCGNLRKMEKLFPGYAAKIEKKTQEIDSIIQLAIRKAQMMDGEHPSKDIRYPNVSNMNLRPDAWG